MTSRRTARGSAHCSDRGDIRRTPSGSREEGRSDTVRMTDETYRLETAEEFLDAFRELRGASRRIAQDKGKAAAEDRELRAELSNALTTSLPVALSEDPDGVTCALTDAANDTRVDPVTRADLKVLRGELLAELTRQLAGGRPLDGLLDALEAVGHATCYTRARLKKLGVELAEASARRSEEEQAQVWERLGKLLDMPPPAAAPDAAAA
jgi:hypothetical protein